MKEDQVSTPMLAQYHKIKSEYPDALLLYRLGDFYELFYEDAKVGARELNIVLTKKKVGKNKYIPMCGIPFHSADSYITRLVAKGHKVAVCEQLEDASKTKGIVKRGVIRVLTPGTYFDNEKLRSALVGILPIGKTYYLSYLDLSTGEFLATHLNLDDLISFIGKFQPKEILLPEGVEIPELKENFKNIFFTHLPENYFSEDSLKELLNFFSTAHFSAFGFEEHEKKALYPAGAVLQYAKSTQKSFLPFINTPKPYHEDRYVRIDYSAQKHLELIHPNEGNVSLFYTIDKTLTGMGKRKLKFMILHPLKDVKEIKERQESIEELSKNHQLRMKIRDILSDIYDIERLVAKISSNTLTPRDMVALRESLKMVLDLKKIENDISSSYLKQIFSNIESYEWLVDKMERYLEDNPPIHLKEGGLIKKGVNEDLDELKKIKEIGNNWIKEYQQKLREETGIQSLKIGFNKVMGYYIEVTKPNIKFVPDYFRRRQTLSNSERFITDELQSFEEKILSSDEKIKALEYEIFMKLREEVALLSGRIAKTAQFIGLLDAITSLSQVAVERSWIKPEVDDSFDLEIEEGLHPTIVEFMHDFVPNDLRMNKNSYFHLITGPNMAGKSTFIRQSAILIILSQIGSFIPAKRAKIGIVDSIFTRIGSGDALAKGLSTFMVEMLEMANILNNATERSFIVLDEVGRGTSTYDGLAIAWAVSEHISQKIKAKTLFATHYHELTQLEFKIKGIKNFHMKISEDGENIKFLYKVVEGFSNKSYGIHVAKLAGIKEEIIKRAYEVLYHFEEESNSKVEYQQKSIEEVIKNEGKELKQLEKTYNNDNEINEIVQKIENIDIGTTTPIDALLILHQLKEMIKTKKL